MGSSRKFVFVANSQKIDIDLFQGIEKYFLDTLDNATFFITNTPEELSDIVSLGADVYVALGGDGTLNTMLNFLRSYQAPFKNNALPIVGVLPFGNGDDFAQSMGFSSKNFSSKRLSKKKDLDDIFKPFIQTQFCDTYVKPIHYGEFWVNKEVLPKQFFSYVGLGLFAQAVECANKQEHKSYFSELKKVYKTADLETFIVTEDSSKAQHELLTFECMNNVQFGGGLKYNPYGSYNSTSFQTIGLQKLSLVEIMKNYLHVKREKGKHLEHKKLIYNPCVHDLFIEVKNPLTLHYDGETIPDVSHVHIRSSGYPIRVITKNI